MANYAIFDEQYYLSQYPWLKPAIDAGIIQSGREHFEKFGQAAGLTKISRYFDEATYLADNPDIAPLVRTSNNPNAPFATGLDHFIQFGYEEGRTRVSPDYDEAFYLANNRDLQPFIQNGNFKNGYNHFIQFGAKQGRFGTSFFESKYLRDNPDIVPLVNSGALKTGREHYFNFGQFEPSRSATFVGTSGNDIVTGVGVGDVTLFGVEVGGNQIFRYFGPESDGSNEFDTLIGSSGRDTFMLATIFTGRRSGIDIEPFYIGPGFATIQNFTKGQDRIQLGGYGGYFLDPYILIPTNNNRDLAIQTNGGDTIAVIEGGGNLKLNLLPESSFGTLLLG
ncbi:MULTISPECIES: calcium-binding protein [unclassified Microcoleus]|uniref:calcium-binding protein n=1 Tax=unclassified Microcoleus TaxID=2642155 RepID=UPI002FCFD7C6